MRPARPIRALSSARKSRLRRRKCQRTISGMSSVLTIVVFVANQVSLTGAQDGDRLQTRAQPTLRSFWAHLLQAQCGRYTTRQSITNHRQPFRLALSIVCSKTTTNGVQSFRSSSETPHATVYYSHTHCFTVLFPCIYIFSESTVTGSVRPSKGHDRVRAIVKASRSLSIFKHVVHGR